MEERKKPRQEQAGFTLVELVVVIAILGILAGIAYVGYGGYIEYAKRAGDDDLIATVNAAFASACEDQGVARLDLGFNGARLKAGENGKPTIQGISWVYGLGDGLADFQNSFDAYFAGNKDDELKSYNISDIIFANGTDMFTVDKDKINSQIKQSFNDSTFAKDKGGMVDSVHNLIQALRNTMKDKGKDKNGEITLDGMLQQLSLFIGGNKDLLKTQFAEFGINENSTPDEIANAAVLWVAKQTTEADPTQLIDKYVNGNMSAKTNHTADLALQILIAKGLVDTGNASAELKTAYETAMNGPNGTHFLGLINQLNTDIKNNEDGYQAYKNGGQMEKDINGCLSLLSALYQNKGQLDLTSFDTFTSGNDDFMDLLDSIVG